MSNIQPLSRKNTCGASTCTFMEMPIPEESFQSNCTERSPRSSCSMLSQASLDKSFNSLLSDTASTQNEEKKRWSLRNVLKKPAPSTAPSLPREILYT